MDDLYKNEIELTLKDFGEDGRVNHAEFQNKLHFICFYMPWCPFCTNMVNEYKKLAEACSTELDNLLVVGEFNCLQLKDEENDESEEGKQSKRIRDYYDIKGYPTIKFIYQENGKEKQIRYQCERERDDYINAACEIITNKGSQNQQPQQQQQQQQPPHIMDGGVFDVLESYRQRFFGGN